MKNILEVKDVSYRYRDAAKDEYVLKDINLEFELGKSYAIKVNQVQVKLHSYL